MWKLRILGLDVDHTGKSYHSFLNFSTDDSENENVVKQIKRIPYFLAFLLTVLSPKNRIHPFDHSKKASNVIDPNSPGLSRVFHQEAKYSVTLSTFC